jgi:DNA-binding HxlR family transcriptional regulator
VPPHVDYELTDLGQEAAKHVVALATWIEAALPQILPRKAAAAQSDSLPAHSGNGEGKQG